ncbi:MAG: hypothetical protein SFX73_20165 [Kofleriaceae bacterium]|nr:hypothetical protein [Kofleriaceae bacterium]
MRWGLLLVAASLGACTKQDRATFDVALTPGTVRLEVFVASQDACISCGLQPQFVDTLLEGMRFERDPDPLLTIEANGDDHAAFAIAPSGDSDKVRSIVVIGYDADQAIRGAALIRDLHTNQQPKLYHVTLTAVTAEPLGPTAPMTSSQRAQVWGSEAAHGSCVGLERWHEATLQDRVFIVPADDPDCDGVLEDAECNPYAYLSSTAADPRVLNCVSNSETVGGVTPCQLGVAICEDGVTSGRCEPKGICIPESMCSDTSICPAGQERQCLLEKLRRRPPSSEIVCRIPFALEQNSNTLTTCTGEPVSMFIQGMSALFTNQAVTCDDVGVIAESTADLQFVAETEVAGATLKVARQGSNKCDVFVTWEGTAQAFSAPVVVGVKLSTTGAHDLVLPLKIVPTECNTDPTAACSLDLFADGSTMPGAPDSIAACAK